MTQQVMLVITNFHGLLIYHLLYPPFKLALWQDQCYSTSNWWNVQNGMKIPPKALLNTSLDSLYILDGRSHQSWAWEVLSDISKQERK